MNEHLLRMKKDTTFCVFDFETEDLNLYTTQPWQFACVVGTQKEILREHDIYMNWPNLNVSKEAEIITRFDPLYVEAHGKNPYDAFKLITEEFEDCDYVVGHNILGFDIHVYRRRCEVLGITPYPIERKLIDTMACGKGIKMNIPYTPGESFLSYQIRLANEKPPKKGFATLNAFCKHYDIPVDETKLHNALYDVQKNYQVLLKMLWNIEI